MFGLQWYQALLLSVQNLIFNNHTTDTAVHFFHLILNHIGKEKKKSHIKPLKGTLVQSKLPTITQTKAGSCYIVSVKSSGDIKYS